MFKLLLPVVFPSWRFFSYVGSSPRIDYTLVASNSLNPLVNPLAGEWREFSVVPQNLTLWQHIKRLFYNAPWNEQLYINTCAEHLMDGADQFYEQQIGIRILNTCSDQLIHAKAKGIKFRIRTLNFDSNVVSEHIAFCSREFVLSTMADSDGGGENAN